MATESMEMIIVVSPIFLGVFPVSSSTFTRQSKKFRLQPTKSFHGVLLQSPITLAIGLLSTEDAAVLLRDHWASNAQNRQ